MMVMMNAIDASYFGGKREITCYSCHRNANLPKVTPTLAEKYAAPILDDVKEIAQQAPGQPSPDQIFDRYLQAIGGSQKLAGFTSFMAKGTYQPYDDPEDFGVEIYAKAPCQFLQIVYGAHGGSTWVDDGRSAWVAQSLLEAPILLVSLVGGAIWMVPGWRPPGGAIIFSGRNQTVPYQPERCLTPEGHVEHPCGHGRSRHRQSRAHRDAGNDNRRK